MKIEVVFISLATNLIHVFERQVVPFLHEKTHLNPAFHCW